MTNKRTITAIDLFCGAGGFSEGLKQACNELGYNLRESAINHDDKAVETHKLNHPDADQYQSRVEQLHPPDVVKDLIKKDYLNDANVDDINDLPGDKYQQLQEELENPKVDLLVGGPECTHFSKARGSQPVSDQRRMSPWFIIDYLEKLDIDAFIIENVPEIRSWDRVIDGQAKKDGAIFDAWVNALNSLGYAVDWTTLTAADYGDPTSRKRFFIIGKKDGTISFPDPTHSDEDDSLPDYRTAAEIIDWSDLGSSIWTRDLTNNRIHNPPKHTTLKRIAEGIRRHCSDALEPYAKTLETLNRDKIRNLRTNRVVDRDKAALMAETIDEPFMVRTHDAKNIEGSILIRQQKGAHPTDINNRSVPTIATAGGHQIATITTSLIKPKNARYGGLHSNSLYNPHDQEMHTITTDPRAKLVTPTLSKLTQNLTKPFIHDFEGPAKSIDKPLNTLETKERFSLCIPMMWPWGFDISYRMLQPDELKKAQGFPTDYKLSGVKSDKNKQIGNAVPVNLAKSLCKHVITETDPSLATFGGGITEASDVEIPDYDEVASSD